MADITKTWQTGDEICAELAGKPLHLAFSCGKDSLALWLRLRSAGVDVRPCYRYLVPGLSFVDESIAYYEKSFGVKIEQYPHDSLFRWLSNNVYQPPEHVMRIKDTGVHDLNLDEGQDCAIRKMGLAPDTWTAVGTRACDNPLRRLHFTKHGPRNYKTRTVYPVWDMNKDGVIETIRGSGIMLPPEYRVFGRSFDGLDFRFLYGIKKHWPADYKKILEWFPLARLELFREEIQSRRNAKRQAS